MSQEAPKSFDTAWEDVFRSQAWGKYPQEHVIRFVARSFYSAPDRKAVRLLDLGSGPGANAWFMAREGFSVSAIDGSPSAIEQLKARFAAEKLEVDARVGDLVRLPYADATFDGVIDNAALCHNRFDACKLIVSEVLRVLKPGGAFLSASLSDEMSGYGQGTPVEPGGFRDITEGPLKGKGFVLFFSRPVIDALYVPFESKVVDRATWTIDGGTHVSQMWIVSCRKPR